MTEAVLIAATFALPIAILATALCNTFTTLQTLKDLENRK